MGRKYLSFVIGVTNIAAIGYFIGSVFSHVPYVLTYIYMVHFFCAAKK